MSSAPAAACSTWDIATAACSVVADTDWMFVAMSRVVALCCSTAAEIAAVTWSSLAMIPPMSVMALTAAPAHSFSLTSLDAREVEAMLAMCEQLPGADGSLCRDVVKDERMSANSKRSCLHAMRAMLQGSTWAAVRGLPAAVTCRASLARGGYPVNSIMQRLAGATSAMR